MTAPTTVLSVIPAWERVKRTDETVTYAMDFVNWVPTGETISSSTWAATVSAGTDASPGSIISGVADIGSDPVVKHQLTGGVSGVWYNVFATTVLSNGDTLVGHVKLLIEDVT